MSQWLRIQDFEPRPTEAFLPSLSLEDMEAQHIKKVIQMFPHSKKQAYEALGIQYNTFEKKLLKFNLIFEKT